jgi:hypothetical protein
VTLAGWTFAPLLDSEPEVSKALLMHLCARLRAVEHM